MLYCEDLEKKGLWDTKDCCSTCHYDNENFDSCMCYITVDDIEYEVCCKAVVVEDEE
jgi:hypothetical protein